MTTKQIVYTPRPGTESDQFTYEVMDGQDATASATVFITVTDVPQAPTATIRLTRADGTAIQDPANIPETDGAVGEPVRLDGTSSLPGNPISPIVSYQWTVNGMNTCSKSMRFSSMLCWWLRPTKPQTASTPSSTAASNVRSMNSCFFCRTAGSWCSRLSK